MTRDKMTQQAKTRNKKSLDKSEIRTREAFASRAYYSKVNG